MFGRNKKAPETFSESGYSNTVSGVERISKKGIGRKIAVIGGVSAAVVVGGGAAAYNLSPFVKNQVRLRVMKPENYYAWVYEENGESFAKKISESYDKNLTRYENGTHSNIRLEYEPTDEALQLFKEDSLLTEEYELDENERALVKAIDETESLGADLDVYSKGGNSKITVSADRNDIKIANFDLMITNAAGDYFARLPQLTEQWLGISLGDAIDKELASDPETKQIIDTLRDMMNDPRSYLSPEELEDEIIRYVGVWNDSVSSVRLKNSEDVEINDITVKYTVATVKLNRRKLLEIGRNFLEEAKDDDIIRRLLIENLGIIDEDEYDSFFDEALEDIDDDLDDDFDEFEEGEQTVSFRTFIDGKGVIRGFEVKQDSDNKFTAVIGKKGKEVSGEISLTDQGKKEFEVDLNAEETGNEEYSGTIELKTTQRRYDRDLEDYYYDTEKITIEFDDFSIENEEYSYFDADIRVIAPDIDPIEIKFDADSDQQSVIYEIEVDDIDYGTLTLSWSTDDDADLEIPDKSESFMIDIESDEEPNLDEYISREDAKSFIKEILMNLGFDEKTAESIAEDNVDDFYDSDVAETFNDILL